MAKTVYRFYIVEGKNEIIDTSKCMMWSEDDGTLTYRKSRFTEVCIVKVVASFNNYLGAALNVISGVLKGAIVTTYGSVAIGVYPAALTRGIGINKVVSEIWLQTDANTMKLWWSQEKGYLR